MDRSVFAGHQQLELMTVWIVKINAPGIARPSVNFDSGVFEN